jgi:hypothetical protein
MHLPELPSKAHAGHPPSLSAMARQAAINIAENVAVAVPHRQFVFTMPKRFRAYFR